MQSDTGRFRRADRILHSRDFRRIISAGERRVSRNFVVFVCEDESPRIGITVSKKVGNAVVRNRVKRQIREWFRATKHRLGPAEIVVIARPAARALAADRVFAELDRTLGSENP